jgi:hypothetical protein
MISSAPKNIGRTGNNTKKTAAKTTQSVLDPAAAFRQAAFEDLVLLPQRHVGRGLA